MGNKISTAAEALKYIFSLISSRYSLLFLFVFKTGNIFVFISKVEMENINKCGFTVFNRQLRRPLGNPKFQGLLSVLVLFSKLMLLS